MHLCHFPRDVRDARGGRDGSWLLRPYLEASIVSVRPTMSSKSYNSFGMTSEDARNPTWSPHKNHFM